MTDRQIAKIARRCKTKDALKILNANYKANDDSFLYYLHEEDYFHEVKFYELCQAMASLHHSYLHDEVASVQIIFIYGQVLRHIIYHFDPKDLSRISNFPCDYDKKLAFLESAIQRGSFENGEDL